MESIRKPSCLHSVVRSVNSNSVTISEEQTRFTHCVISESNDEKPAIFDLMDSIYCEINIDMTIRYMNAFSLKLLNYTQYDVENGILLNELLPEWELERMLQVIKKILCNDYGNKIEYQIVSRDGVCKTVSTAGYPLIEEDKIAGIVVIGQDLTELRHFEKQYRKSEKRFSNMFTHSPIGMAFYIEDGTIVKKNNMFNRFLSGTAASTNLPDNITTYFGIDKKLKNRLDMGEAVTFEKKHPFDGNYYRYMEWHLSRINEQKDILKTYMAQVIDITERKNDENKTTMQVESVFRIANGLRKNINRKLTFKNVISLSPCVEKIFNKIPQIAQSNASVLILGESGTGKDIVARLIHENSRNKKGPLISINCGSIPENLIESEMFGHKAGAFTDAKKDKKGKFLLAQEGTLFLDEIGDMPFQMQVKLLRVLETRKFFPLGSEREVSVDTRIIAATHQSLKTLVKEGKFRQDLYFRLNVIKIELPPLRKRVQDIVPLCRKFIRNANERFNKNITELSVEVQEYLLRYRYPGNIRELENIIDQMVIFSNDTILRKENLPEEVICNRPFFCSEQTNEKIKKYLHSSIIIPEEEKNKILSVLEETKGNKTHAAELLGIHRTTLIRKLKKWA